MTTQPPFPQFTPQQVSGVIRAGLPARRPPTALSPDDAANKAATYRHSLADYRQHAQEYLAIGDYRQAAEKSWGAYTQTIKAIAADHRLLVPTHSGILRVSGQMTDLVSQSGRQDIADTLTRGLIAARALHTHFYESDMPGGSVQVAADDVAATIDLLQRLFPPETP